MAAETVSWLLFKQQHVKVCRQSSSVVHWQPIVLLLAYSFDSMSCKSLPVITPSSTLIVTPWKLIWQKLILITIGNVCLVVFIS
jgi:hypothetical protein